MDTFAFGLLLFYCLTGGQHAFGEGYERDYRILNVCPFPTTLLDFDRFWTLLGPWVIGSRAVPTACTQHCRFL